jgi:DNA topoisomerase-1
MAKSLVIIESPAKARTIGKFLGKDFQVKASIGHVKDLPKSKLGVDIEHDFQPEYVTIKGKGKIIAEIKKAAKVADKIYLAPDPDREGEAIAWHIAEELNGDRSRIYRVLFNEITERGVLEAIKKPMRLDRNKYEAQQARRILDRLVGYEISPLLWKKVRRGLSAGRVQSVTVRLICEREAAIKAFVPEEYWSITAELRGHGSEESFRAKLAKEDGKKLKVKDSVKAQQILQEIEGSKFTVTGIEKKEKKRFPLPPFITSRLQQEAARKLGFTVKKTMLVAQQLYEGMEIGKEGSVGLITYMRTDSTRVSSQAISETRDFINFRFGKDYLPAKPNIYRSKKGAQDAHEAIRPTYLKYPPYDIEKYLSKDHFNLYNLIWKCFVASQMNPAVFDQTTVQIEVEASKSKLNRYTFQASGSVVKFDGFTRVYVEGRDKNGEGERSESILPPLEKGEVLRLLSIEPKQHFTQPPPRFTEASLVKELEDNGIGRPSTYAPTLSTIQEREYVTRENKQFIPTELGLLVTDLLVKSFPQVLDAKFTAHLEEDLDKVEEGNMSWLKVVREFYMPFRALLDKASIEMKDVKREETPTDIKCEKCGKTMMIKWGRRGQFLACSGYPECKNTKDFVLSEDGSVRVVEEEETGEMCPTCGKPMIVKTGRYGRFLACSNYPECKTAKPISTGVRCPIEGCNGELVERRSKKGKVFYSCSNYPRCTFATWERPLGEKCPKCDYPILLERHTKSGAVVKSCPNKGCVFKKEIT